MTRTDFLDNPGGYLAELFGQQPTSAAEQEMATYRPPGDFPELSMDRRPADPQFGLNGFAPPAAMAVLDASATNPELGAKAEMNRQLVNNPEFGSTPNNPGDMLYSTGLGLKAGGGNMMDVLSAIGLGLASAAGGARGDFSLPLNVMAQRNAKLQQDRQFGFQTAELDLSRQRFAQQSKVQQAVMEREGKTARLGQLKAALEISTAVSGQKFSPETEQKFRDALGEDAIIYDAVKEGGDGTNAFYKYLLEQSEKDPAVIQAKMDQFLALPLTARKAALKTEEEVWRKQKEVENTEIAKNKYSGPKAVDRENMITSALFPGVKSFNELDGTVTMDDVTRAKGNGYDLVVGQDRRAAVAQQAQKMYEDIARAQKLGQLEGADEEVLPPDQVNKLGLPYGTTRGEARRMGAGAYTPKQREDLASYQTARTVIEDIKKYSEKVNVYAGGLKGRAKQFFKMTLGGVTQSNTDAAMLMKKAGELASIARSLGEKGALANADVARAAALVPGPSDTVEVAQKQLEDMIDIIRKGEQAYRASMGQNAPGIHENPEKRPAEKKTAQFNPADAEDKLRKALKP